MNKPLNQFDELSITTQSLNNLVCQLLIFTVSGPKLPSWILQQASHSNNIKTPKVLLSSNKQYKQLLMRQFLSNEETYEESQDLTVSFGMEMNSQQKIERLNAFEQQSLIASPKKINQNQSQQTLKNTTSQDRKTQKNNPYSIIYTNFSKSKQNQQSKTNQEQQIRTIDLRQHHKIGNLSPEILQKKTTKICQNQSQYLRKFLTKKNAKKIEQTGQSFQNSVISVNKINYGNNNNAKDQEKKHYEYKKIKVENIKENKEQRLSQKKHVQQIKYSIKRSPEKKDRNQIIGSPNNFSSPKSFCKSKNIGKQEYQKSPKVPISISICLSPFPPESQNQSQEQKELIKQISNDIKGLIKKIQIKNQRTEEQDLRIQWKI